MSENDGEYIDDDLYEEYDPEDDLGPLRAGLTIKERRFAEYFTGAIGTDEGGGMGNQTKAARLAGYKDTPHLPRQAFRLRNKPAICAYIDGLFDAYGVSRGQIVANLSAVAFQPWPEPFPVTLDDGTVVMVRADLRSKVEACRLLMQYRGAFPPKGKSGFGSVRVSVRDAA